MPFLKWCPVQYGHQPPAAEVRRVSSLMSTGFDTWGILTFINGLPSNVAPAHHEP